MRIWRFHRGRQRHCCRTVFVHDDGVIGGELTPLKFGRALVAQEVFWWAERDGLTLLRAFESWAESKGADLICMAALERSRLSKLYLRRGYQPKENFYVRVI